MRGAPAVPLHDTRTAGDYLVFTARLSYSSSTQAQQLPAIAAGHSKRGGMHEGTHDGNHAREIFFGALKS